MTDGLLERERELVELAAALTDAQQGRGRVVLVEAPAGIGKTSLLRAACRTAVDAGFTYLRARATELERDFAYGCVRQLFEPPVAKASDVERERLFDGAAALAKPLLAPDVTPEPSSDGAFSVLHGLYWLLNHLADDAPVALGVDDLHWADAESLRFLGYLAPRLDGLRVAVIGSARAGEAVPDLARLAAAPETTVLRPGPLSVQATATLCEQSLGAGVADEFAAACREATGGNPFFLEALLREASEQKLSTDEPRRVRRLVPAAVAQAVLLRLSSAPAAATALVRAVAVLGDGAGLHEAAALAELDDEEAAAAADLLVALALLRPGERLEFAHPIVREAVHADVGPRARGQAHARAAEILAASGAAEERIAAQVVEAEPAGDPGRVELLRRVGADALARGAPAAAQAWLGRALAEPPPPAARGAVLLELGEAELRLGAPAAVEHLTEAADRIAEPEPRTTAVRRLAHALTQSGSPDRAMDAILQAIDVVASQDEEQALLLEAELGYHAQHAGPEGRARTAGRLERFADRAGDTLGERLALAALACERARHAASASEAAAHLERAVAAGERQLEVAGVFYDLVIGLLAADVLDVADACLEQALADANARASIPEIAYVTCWRGWVSLRRGALGQAEADARTALHLLSTHELLGVRFALGLLVEALVEAGELDAAQRALRDSGLGEEIPSSRANNYMLEARGLLHLAQGRPREGLEDLAEYGRRDERWGSANPLASRWRSRSGDRDLVAEDLERARRWGSATGLGIALRATALANGGDAAGLREAVDVLERSPARLEHARALVDLGAAQRRANHRAEARTALQAGLELAERCGARALAADARTELRAAGGRAKASAGTGLEQLTASERRVAELAAGGRSNPEIAQSLFVTRKTVETHLGRIYRKLDIARRDQLAAALTD